MPKDVAAQVPFANMNSSDLEICNNNKAEQRKPKPKPKSFVLQTNSRFAA